MTSATQRRDAPGGPPSRRVVPLEVGPKQIGHIVVAASAGPDADQVIKALAGWIDPHLLHHVQSVDGEMMDRLRDEPGLLLIDTRLLAQPERALDPMHTQWPGLRTLIFGAQTDDDRLVRLVRAGAHGYLALSPDVNSIRLAVSAVLAGRVWFDQHILARCLSTHPSLDEQLASRLSANIDAMSCQLSGREKEILCEVIKGSAIKQIAAEVHLSHQGVKLHLARLFKKFGASNRHQLILAVLDRVSPLPRLSASLCAALHADLLETRD